MTRFEDAAAIITGRVAINQHVNLEGEGKAASHGFM